MNRCLTDRLLSLAGACVVTFGLMTGIHTLAASEAASASRGELAQATGAPMCAKV